jgi:hypothetical protein
MRQRERTALKRAAHAMCENARKSRLPTVNCQLAPDERPPLLPGARHCAGAVRRAARAGGGEPRFRHGTGGVGARPRAWGRIGGSAASGQRHRLAQLFACAPSAVYRHMWRLLAERERTGAPDASLLMRLLHCRSSLPAAKMRVGANGVAAIATDAGAYAALLREHGALARNETVALGNALVSGSARPAQLRIAGVAYPAAAIAQPLALPCADSCRGRRRRGSIAFSRRRSACGIRRRYLSRRDGRPWAPAGAGRCRSLATPGIAVLALPRRRAAGDRRPAGWRRAGRRRAIRQQLDPQRAATGERWRSSACTGWTTPRGRKFGCRSSPFDPRQAEGFAVLCCRRPRGRRRSRALRPQRVPGRRCAHPRRRPCRSRSRHGITLLFKAEGAPPAPPYTERKQESTKRRRDAQRRSLAFLGASVPVVSGVVVTAPGGVAPTARPAPLTVQITFGSPM